MMKKIFRKLHLWLSVPFGIFITLICFSGAMLVFEKEITEMCRRDLYFVKEVKDKPLPIDSLMKTVSATLPDTVSVTGVTISPDPERAWQVSLSKPRRSSVYVDQYTGEVKGRSERLAFYNVMFHMHRWLMGSSQGLGKLLVGISTLFLVIILITGILMWLTNRKKPLKKSLTISFTKGWPKFWHDLHVAGGIYATIFLLALALTGLTWSFSWYRSGFYAMFGVEASAGGHGGSHGGERGGKHGGRPDGERSGRRSGAHTEGRDSVAMHVDGAEKLHRHDAGSDERKEHRGDWAAHKKNASEAVKSDVSDVVDAQQEKENHAERRMKAGGDVEADVREEGHSYGGDGEGRRGRGGRGGRGGRYHHDSDSTGAYAGRHSADSLYHGRRHERGGNEMADNSREYAGMEADGSVKTSAGNAGRGSRGGRGFGEDKKRGRGKEMAQVHGGNGADRVVGVNERIVSDSVAVGTIVSDMTPEEETFAHWQDVYDALVKDNPGYRQITLSDGSAGVVPAGRNSLRAADKFEFDPMTGTITGCSPYSEQNRSAKVRSGVYTVHVGSWGGMVTRIITFIAALLGATLPLTGYYLWIRRLIMKRRNRKAKKA